MKKSFRLQSLWPFLLCLLLVSCSLKTPDGVIKLRVQPNRTWGDFFHSFGIPWGERTPSAVTGMDCYFATITGEAIPAAPLPTTSHLTNSDGSCPALGATSPLVSYAQLSNEGAPISVRKGSNRVIKIFGVVSRTPNGCSGKTHLSDFVGASFRPNVYEVGSTTTDLMISPSTIYIETSYNSATATDLIETCTGVQNLSLSATSSTITVSNTTILVPSGGVSPYTYAVVSGSGSAGPTTALFTPAGTGNSVVEVTDATGFKAQTTVSVRPVLSLSASPTTIAVGNSSTATPAGGVAPFTYDLMAGTGSVNTVGVFTPTAAGTATIRVTDSLGNAATTDVTVNPALGISPTSAQIMVTNTQPFSGIGGVSPFTFSVDAGGVGSINALTGVYSAGTTAGTATVRVTDSLGTSSTAPVTVAAQLAIIPSTKTIAATEALTYSSSGGVGTVTFSKISGPGSVTSNVYTPGSVGSGSAVIRATDSLGNTADSSVTIVTPLSVHATALEIAPPQTVTITTQGGVGSASLSLTSGPTGLNTSTGVYSPQSSGTGVITATDQNGNTDQVSITVRAPLAIIPSSKTIAANETLSYSSSGGVGTVSFTKVSGPGSMTSNMYSPGSVGSGSAVIRATDANGNTSDSSVTIVTPLSAHSTSLEIAPPETVTITTQGGVGTATLALTSGPSGLNASTGVYAPTSSGTGVITATDQNGNTDQVSITVRAQLAIIPASKTIAANESISYSSSGGVGTVSFTKISGPGSVTTNVYTPGSVGSGSAVIRATDANGNTSDSSVNIQPPLSLNASLDHIVVGQTATLTPSGGVGSATLTRVSGPMGLDAANSKYTPTSSGTGKIRATDTNSNTADVEITVEEALAIVPASKSIMVGETINFSATGGVLPLAYDLVSGPSGLSNANYTPTSSGSASVRVSDSAGNTSTSSVTVYPALSIDPSSKTIALGETVNFTTNGGVPTVSLNLQSGPDTLTGKAYTPDSKGTGVIRAKDANGNTTDATITITDALSIVPSSKTIAKNESITFSSNGGVGSKTYSLTSGVGGVTEAGVYTTSNQTGSAEVKVTDANGNSASSDITVVAQLGVGATRTLIAVGEPTTLTRSGGVGSVTYSVQSGPSGVSGSTYTPTSSGTAVILGTDANGNTATVEITVNPALTISPTSVTTAVGRTVEFSSGGGVGTRTLSVVSGTGTGSGNLSPATILNATAAGSLVVRVTDDNGNTADSNVTINSALSLSPSSPSMVPGSQMTFQGLGGVAPYAYSVYTGGGSVGSMSGVYTAGDTAFASATLRVTDSQSYTSDSNVTIVAPLTISPNSHTMAVNTTRTFTKSGGVGTVGLSLVAGSAGSFDTATGTYTAPSTTGTATVRATDSQLQTNNTADASITIVRALAVTPTSKTLVKGSSFAFTASHGVSPYFYSAVGGSTSSNTYTAPNAIGTDTFTVTDSQTPTPNTAQASITIVNALNINPSAPSVALGDVVYFSGGGGVSPYTYEIVSGAGTLDSSGLFHRTWEAGSSVIRVTDSVGLTADATATLVPGAFQLGAGPSYSFPAFKEFRLDSSGNMLIYGSTGGQISGTNFTQYGFHGYKDVVLANVGVSGYRRWVSQIGLSSSFLEPYDLKLIETSGVSYITGKVQGSLGGNQFGTPGSYDVFIAKFDSSGVRTWVTQIGTMVGGVTSAELGRSLALQSDGSAIVCGNTTSYHSDFSIINNPGTSNPFFVRIPASLASAGDSGQVSRGVLIGAVSTATSTRSLGCALTSDQTHVYLAGVTTGHLINSVGDHGLSDVFVAKFSADDNATTQWIRQRGPLVNGDSYPVGLERGADDDLFLYGSTTGRFGTVPSHGDKDAFVMKYSEAGIEKWTTQLAGGPSTTTSIVPNGFITKAGATYVYGNTDGTVSTRSAQRVYHDVWVAKIDATTGAPVWVYQKGSAGSTTSAGSFLVDDSGNVYLYGSTDGSLGLTQINPTRGYRDAFVIKLNSSGVFQWGYQLGKSGLTTQAFAYTDNPEISDFLMDSSGNIYAYGLTDGDLGGTSIAPNSRDRFILKIKSDGSLGGVTQFGGSSYASVTSGVLALSSFVPGFLFAFGDTTETLTGHQTGVHGYVDNFIFKFKAFDLAQQ